MFLKGATSFERYHPMTQLGQLMGWDSAQLDALWTKAAPSLKRKTTSMARTSLERSLALVFGHEGGFSDDRHDRGNWTTGGIGSGILKGTKFGFAAMSYPTLDIENLTLAQAAAIYGKDYAAAIRFDSLPAGVDHAALDFAINSGPSRAVIGLQRAVGVADDGEMGPLTLAAVSKADPAVVIRTLVRRAAGLPPAAFDLAALQERLDDARQAGRAGGARHGCYRTRLHAAAARHRSVSRHLHPARLARACCCPRARFGRTGRMNPLLTPIVASLANTVLHGPALMSVLGGVTTLYGRWKARTPIGV